MQQWDYLTVELQPQGRGTLARGRGWTAEFFTEQLKSYGTQGWELVSCFPTARGYGETVCVFATFKRAM